MHVVILDLLVSPLLTHVPDLRLSIFLVRWKALVEIYRLRMFLEKFKKEKIYKILFKKKRRKKNIKK